MYWNVWFQAQYSHERGLSVSHILVNFCHALKLSLSRGGNLVVTVMYKILEFPEPLPRPVALVFCYAALDFNFNSWMSPADLKVLRSEQSTANLAGLAEQKDHYNHKSPLAVINDVQLPSMRRRKSWTTALTLGNTGSAGRKPITPTLARTRSMFRRKTNPFSTAMGEDADEEGNVADGEDGEDEEEEILVEERDKPIAQRVVFTEYEQREQQQAELSEAVAEALTLERNAKKAPIGTRLTMTSRTGYFQDRIISPSMVGLNLLCQACHMSTRFRCARWLFCTLDPNEIPISRRIITYHPFWVPARCWRSSRQC